MNPVVGGADDGVRATEVIASFDSGRPNPLATPRGEIAAELGVKESSPKSFGDDGMLLPEWCEKSAPGLFSTETKPAPKKKDATADDDDEEKKKDDDEEASKLQTMKNWRFDRVHAYDEWSNKAGAITPIAPDPFMLKGETKYMELKCVAFQNTPGTVTMPSAVFSTVSGMSFSGAGSAGGTFDPNLKIGNHSLTLSYTEHGARRARARARSESPNQQTSQSTRPPRWPLQTRGRLSPPALHDAGRLVENHAVRGVEPAGPVVHMLLREVRQRGSGQLEVSPHVRP